MMWRVSIVLLSSSFAWELEVWVSGKKLRPHLMFGHLLEGEALNIRIVGLLGVVVAWAVWNPRTNWSRGRNP